MSTSEWFNPDQFDAAREWLDANQQYRVSWLDMPGVTSCLKTTEHIIYVPEMEALDVRLRALSPEVVTQVAFGPEPDWADLSVVDKLRRMGWACQKQGDVIVLGGLWGDAQTNDGLAAIVFLAPYLTSGSAIFGDRRDDTPLVAYNLARGPYAQVRFTTDITRSVSYDWS